MLGLERLKKGGGRVEGELCHRNALSSSVEVTAMLPTLPRLEDFVIGLQADSPQLPAYNSLAFIEGHGGGVDNTPPTTTTEY